MQRQTHTERRVPCEGTDTQREDSHVKTEAEITMMQLQAKEHQALPPAARNQKRKLA